MKRTGTVVGLVTFGVFMTEAIMHYNMGYRATKDVGEPKFKFPPTDDFIKLAAIVGVASVLNALIINSITK